MHTSCLGNISEHKDPLVKGSTRALTDSTEATGLTVSTSAILESSVQTQQPCSVKASLSSDICSGVASEGGDVRGNSGQGDFISSESSFIQCLKQSFFHRGTKICVKVRKGSLRLSFYLLY